MVWLIHTDVRLYNLFGSVTDKLSNRMHAGKKGYQNSHFPVLLRVAYKVCIE